MALLLRRGALHRQEEPRHFIAIPLQVRALLATLPHSVLRCDIDRAEIRLLLTLLLVRQAQERHRALVRLAAARAEVQHALVRAGHAGEAAVQTPRDGRARELPAGVLVAVFAVFGWAGILCIVQEATVVAEGHIWFGGSRTVL